MTGSDGGIAGASGGTGGMGGMLAPALLAIDPASKDLGTVVITHFADATFQVSNTGGAATSVPTVTLDGTDAAQYAVTSNGCTAAIDGAKSCLVTVRFTPTTSGLKSARLNVRATLGGAVIANLQGSGIPQGALTIAPTNRDLGMVLVGQRGTASTFTVTNTGGAATGALATAISDSTEVAITTDGCNGLTLAPQATCTLTVALSPTTAGQKSASLSVTASPGGTASSGLTGVGLAPAALSISPTSATLPTTAVGSTSAPTSFTVTNTGGVAAGTTTALSAVLGGNNPTEFVLSSNTCSATPMLAAGATCTVAVAFKPTSTGSKAATVGASATPGGSASAALSATAQSPAALSLDPATGASADFGVVVTTASASQTFVVSNGGQQAATALTITLASTDFTVSAAAAGDCVSGTTVLAGGATCTIHVRLASAAAGSKTATLQVSAATGGSKSLALTGNVVTPGALSISPPSLTFNSVLQGTSGTPSTFTVTNTGGTTTGTLGTAVTGSSEYTISTDNCRAKTLAAAGTCTIAVTFSPASGGQKTGTLTVSATPGGSTSANLVGVGLTPAVLTMTPTALTFPAGTVSGTTSAAQTFTVTNTGDVASGAVSAVLGGTAANQFTIASNTCPTSAAGLAGGATCVVGVTFKPTSPGSKAASLSVSATPGGSVTSTLSAVALAPATLTAAAATGSSAMFGSILMGSSALQTFVVSNSGQQATTAITIVVSGTDFAAVTPAAGDCVSGSTTLAPAATCTVSVRFAPTAALARTGTLTASATTGGSAMVPLTGAGIAPSALSLVPMTQAFGSVLQGSPSGAHSFTITNTGGAMTGVISTSIVGTTEFAITGDTCRTTMLAAGGTCSITVVMTPTSPGAKNASLQVTANPGGAPSATLTGTGLAPAALSGSPAALAFGTVVVGGASGSQLFTVTNNGGVASGTPSAVLSGANSGDFTISNGCNAAVPAGTSCNVTVTFRPGSAGAKSATLTVSASPGNSAATMLTGTGQTAAVLSIAGTNDFGTVVIGTPKTQTYTVSNTGQQTSGELTIALSGADFAGATVGATPCASGVTVLAGGASCTIGVTFNPTVTGARTARLSVTASPGSSPAVNLTGNGKLPTGSFAEFAVPVNEDVAMTGLAVGPDGNIYFCLDGAFRLSLAPGNVGMVSFVPAAFSNSPFMVARGSDGNLWYTVYSPATIARLSPSSGAFMQFPVPVLGGAAVGPFHIISAPDGNLWFTEFTNSPVFIHRMTTAGAELPFISVAGTFMTVGSDGNVWATESGNNKLARINPTTAGVTEFPIPTAAAGSYGIAATPDGNIWFVENTVNKIGRFTIATSQMVEFTIPTAGSGARYIAAGSDGNAWFTELSTNKVARITPAGAITEFVVPTTNSNPLDIIGGPDGNLYFIEQRANAIGRIAP